MYIHWVTMDMDDPSLTLVPLNPLPAEHDNEGDSAVRAQREYIRENITNRPNHDLTHDQKAMALFRDLGSDLSINAFVCNFRLADGTPNEDMVEANYLNERIYERLSVTKWNKRCTDLEIPVNCVMSPFLTAANFTKGIADEFHKVAREEIEACLPRNTIAAADFRFIVQGTDKLHLTLLPVFNMANYRHQLILSCDVPPEVMDKYRDARDEDSSTCVILATFGKARLDDILAGIFRGCNGQGIAKGQSEFMYFYLYGTPEQQHIEHLLVSAENVQLTSDQVQLILTEGGQLSNGDLAKGVIVRFEDVREQTVLPALPPNTPAFFRAGTTHDFTIFRDSHGPDVHGPSLTEAYVSASPIASGRMTLGKMVWADSVMFNEDPLADGAQVQADSAKGKTLEERLNATRRKFQAEDATHADGYYKKHDKQAGWRICLGGKIASIGHNPAGGDLVVSSDAPVSVSAGAKFGVLTGVEPLWIWIL
ncbi:pyridoxal-dependent decarboxylase domain protein [Ceratobasidium sp. AG-Ba]|nr:pyridoxal-dependent decarboxylase domain protein [Ceratobasidium sp. AG-Ba]QRW10776.1 pyridoxal-dependent decarboxylase domain protein [Ceratobasidium sp. AG-Ba]